MNFKRWISYLFSIKLKKINSHINGDLEVMYKAGKMVLDSKNANYSYGSLYDVFNESINHFKLKFDTQSVLILGFGAGSIAHILRKRHKHQYQIQGIEIDAVVLDLYAQYFENLNVKLHCIDAKQFLETTKDTFDFVFIDLFIDLNNVEIIYQEIFWDLIKNQLNTEAKVMLNFISKHKDDKENIQFLLFKKFKHVQKFEYNNLNTVFLVQ